MNGITESEQPEQVALFPCCQADHQGGCNKPFQARFIGVGITGTSAAKILSCSCGASAEPRGVDRHIDLLCLFNLEDFGDGMATLGGGLPVDFIEAVTGDVFAQLLELSSLAVLAPNMNAVAAPVEEECGQVVPFLRQVGV